MDSVEYRQNDVKLRNNYDVRTMFSIFGHYSSKELIEILIQPRTYEDLRACENRQDEGLSLADPNYLSS